MIRISETKLQNGLYMDNFSTCIENFFVKINLFNVKLCVVFSHQQKQKV